MPNILKNNNADEDFEWDNDKSLNQRIKNIRTPEKDIDERKHRKPPHP